MPKLLLIGYLIVNVIQVRANAIDRIRTGSDVVTFLHDKIDTSWDEYKVFDIFNEVENNTKGAIKDSFIKIDLNKDGLTDLVVNGRYLFVVVDKGNGKFSISFIDGGRAFPLRKYILYNIIRTTNQPLLVILHNGFGWVTTYKTTINKNDLDSTNRATTGYGLNKINTFDTVFVNGLMDSTTFSTTVSTISYGLNGINTFDTIIVKFGGLIEYNNEPNNFQINKIVFSTDECFGPCPIYEITIGRNRLVTYNAIKYIQDSGKFSCYINRKAFKQLMKVVNYINVKSLDTSYSVPWTDDQTAYLEIEFKDGTVKKIEDYGMIGTFGLQTLYGQFDKMRKSLNWTRIPSY